MTDHLLDHAAVPADDLTRLRDRLAAASEAEGLLEIAYRTLESPIGGLLLAATPRGVVRIAFESEGTDHVLSDLAERVSPRILAAPQRLDRLAVELEEYFAGKRTSFDVPLDFAMSVGFRERVQRFLPSIGYGRTLSYKDVAEAVGNASAVRAVGSACATNPLPVIVPCHRVLRSDGSLGGYLGGLPAKQLLLDLERGDTLLGGGA